MGSFSRRIWMRIKKNKTEVEAVPFCFSFWEHLFIGLKLTLWYTTDSRVNEERE